MSKHKFCLVWVCLLAWTASTRADIFRNSGQLIPGTEGITAGPGVQLDHRQLDNASLQFLDLTDSHFDFSNLANANFQFSTLTNANLMGANLADADFGSSTLTNANLTGAVVTGAYFGSTTFRGFAASQLYSTKSYQDKNLSEILLASNDLTGWDFHDQNLAFADLTYSTLTNANFTGANLANADFSRSTLTNANLTGANLANADFSSSTLTNANLMGAVVTGTHLAGASGFTASQLYSTKSYQDKNLSGIGLHQFLTGWDFQEQNLANADFSSSRLTNANLTGADMRGAESVNLAGADSRNAILPAGNVVGLALALGDKLVVRDEDGVPDPALTSWLNPRDPIPVTIQNQMTMTDGGILQLLFDADPWGSLISFQSGIPVQLGGTLELKFAPQVNMSSQIGRTLHLFDWTGVSPTGQFQVASPFAWDVSLLYTTGEVTLLSVPEPSAILLASATFAAATLLRCRRRRLSVG